MTVFWRERLNPVLVNDLSLLHGMIERLSPSVMHNFRMTTAEQQSHGAGLRIEACAPVL